MAQEYLRSYFESNIQPKNTRTAASEARKAAEKQAFEFLETLPRTKKHRSHPRKKTPEPSVRKPVLDKVSRDIINQDFQRKADECKALTERLKQEQIQRKLREQYRRKEKERQFFREIESEQQRRREESSLRNFSIKSKLLEHKDKRQKEREEVFSSIKKGQDNYREVISEVPLYRKMEEQYTRNQQMKELKDKNELIARKKDYGASVSLEEIKEHARKHQQLLKSVNSIPKSKHLETQLFLRSLPKNSIFDTIREQEKQRQILEENERNEKKGLMIKTKLYSDIVKQMFMPTPNPRKQLELQLSIENLKHKPRALQKSSVSKSEHVVKAKPKPVSKTVEQLRRKEFVKIDYLKEIKQNKVLDSPLKVNWKKYISDDKLTDEMRSKKIRNYADSIERKALVSENKIQHYSEPGATKHYEKVSGMLIESIKAKLALLGNDS